MRRMRRRGPCDESRNAMMRRRIVMRMMNTKRNLGLGAMAAALLVTASGAASAQSFDSGSTGDDGDFDLTGKPSGTIVEFDPTRIARVNGKDAGNIDPERDNVFHFKTITIPTGVT